MEKEKSTHGLQSKIWDGYFDEDKDSIMGSWHRCMICNKIPSEIYHESQMFFTIWHCRNCKDQDYIPKNLLEKFLIYIDKKLE
jgi:hypothetical protein